MDNVSGNHTLPVNPIPAVQENEVENDAINQEDLDKDNKSELNFIAPQDAVDSDDEEGLFEEEIEENIADWREIVITPRVRHRNVDVGQVPYADTMPEFNGYPAGAKDIPPDCVTPAAFFKLFLTENIVTTIVDATNAYGNHKDNHWKNMTNSELYKLIGILFSKPIT
jgi:hypothetical protein